MSSPKSKRLSAKFTCEIDQRDIKVYSVVTLRKATLTLQSEQTQETIYKFDFLEDTVFLQELAIDARSCFSLSDGKEKIIFFPKRQKDLLNFSEALRKQCVIIEEYRPIYKKVETLGKGGYASVAKIYRRADQAEFAVKEFKKENPKRPVETVLKYYSNEVKILKYLKGMRNIPNFVEAYETRERFALITNCFHGQTLGALLHAKERENQLKYQELVKRAERKKKTAPSIPEDNGENEVSRAESSSPDILGIGKEISVKSEFSPDSDFTPNKKDNVDDFTSQQEKREETEGSPKKKCGANSNEEKKVEQDEVPEEEESSPKSEQSPKRDKVEPGSSKKPEVAKKSDETDEIPFHKEGLGEGFTKKCTHQILEVLYRLELANVIHSDIKPDNIIFSSDTSASLNLIDFGTAKIEESHSVLPPKDYERAKRVCGTLGYLAPEVLSGYPANYRSDVFSVGIVVHSLLFGESPFRAHKDDLYSANKRVKIDWENEIYTKCSPEAIDFLKRVLTRKPADRMSISEALNHPWLKLKTDSHEALDAILEDECDIPEESSRVPLDNSPDKEPKSMRKTKSIAGMIKPFRFRAFKIFGKNKPTK